MNTKMLYLAILLVGISVAQGIENLRISVAGSNAILSWPSLTNETYIVQYRETLSTNTPWTNLALKHLAKAGTNWTTFTHSNIVAFPPPCGTNSGGSLDGPPGFDAASLAGGDDPTQETAAPLSLDDLLPYPWNPRYQATGATSFNRNGATIADAENGAEELSSPCPYATNSIGFYRVVRTGVHVIGLTNGMVLSGQVVLPIEIGSTNGDLESVLLTANGAAFAGAQLLAPPFPKPYLYFVIDTLTLSNSSYDVEVTATVSTATNETTPAVILSSGAVTVLVTNTVAFPDWIPQFGQESNSFLIKASSLQTNVDWRADIYGTNDTYIGSFTNHSANGQIQAVWNLHDASNVLRNDLFFNVVVTTMAGGVTNAARAPTSYRNFERWVGPGDWVIANQQAWEDYSYPDLLDSMTDGFVLNALFNGYYVFPSPGGDYSAFRIPTAVPSDPTPNAYWVTFKQAVTNATARNFYYFGHGGPTKMGLATAARTFTTAELAALLHTAVPGDTNRHSYRFAFVDGCNSANGDFPTAFGVAKKEKQSLQDFANAAMRPNAFVGWKSTKWATVFNQVFFDHVNFIAHFQFEWYDDARNLRDAFDHASNYSDASGVGYSSLKIYGYEELFYDQFNNPP